MGMNRGPRREQWHDRIARWNGKRAGVRARAATGIVSAIVIAASLALPAAAQSPAPPPAPAPAPAPMPTPQPAPQPTPSSSQVTVEVQTQVQVTTEVPQPVILARPGSVARPKLGVLRVRPTPSVQASATSAGTLGDLTRIIESLDPQLINALQGTGKFTVIARSDLEEILNEHEIQRTIMDDPARAFRLAGVDYGVVFTIDDYRDNTAIMRSNRPGESDRVARASRAIDISIVAAIYDINTGEVYESAAMIHQIQKDLEYGTSPAATGIVDKQFRDMLLGVSPALAERAVRAVLNSVFPARVLHVDAGTVTLSWGEGTTIAPGQVWRVSRITRVEDLDFPGEFVEIEHPIARVRVAAVGGRSASATVIDGAGLERGQIARLDESPVQARSVP